MYAKPDYDWCVMFLADVVAKTGRPGKGDSRERKTERLHIALTESQRKQLNWLIEYSGLSIAEMFGDWVEKSFTARGGVVDAPVPDAEAKLKKFFDFVNSCRRGVGYPAFERVKLAHELDAEEELIEELQCCLLNQWRIREGANAD